MESLSRLSCFPNGMVTRVMGSNVLPIQLMLEASSEGIKCSELEAHFFLYYVDNFYHNFFNFNGSVFLSLFLSVLHHLFAL
jgi:hypothetical protein